jgi:hypothetical protein
VFFPIKGKADDIEELSKSAAAMNNIGNIDHKRLSFDDV